ncbi:MAG: DUF2142 domain-containing protein [Thermoleophilaceae bacterium]|nr:DUF2142 domain-containing protein [Thermoleophilaceae bacterium]
MGKVRSTPVPALFALFLLLIGVAWALADPPGAGPDEPAHYIKALGVGGGDLYGRSLGGPTPAEVRALTNTRRSPEELAQLKAFLGRKPSAGALWQRRTSREFAVPAGLSFSAFGCGYQNDDNWSCLDEGESSATATDRPTYVGTYQPYMYAAPGLVMRAVGESQTAMRLGRLVNAAVSFGLLVVAALVLWDRSRGALSLVGLMVAVTPAVVFFASILNPSGPELTSAICFAACLLRLTRTTECPGWVWLACGGSGAVLGLSRSLGPVFVVLLVAAVVVLAGWRGAAAVLKAAPRRSAATAAMIAIACAAGAFWEREYQPHVPWGPGTILDGLDPSIDNLPHLPKQAVGVFGGTDIYMPLTFYIVWWLMLAALLAAAFYVGRGLERASLPALAVAIVLATLGLSAVYRQVGYELTARYILPFAMLLPLWAGELLSRRRDPLHPRAARTLIIAVAVGAAAVHAVAWYTHGRRVSVGVDGNWLFAPDAGWVPPLGWWAWIAVVLAAAGAYVLAGLRAGEAVRSSA